MKATKFLLSDTFSSLLLKMLHSSTRLLSSFFKNYLISKKIYPSGSYDKISAEMLSDDNFVECYHRILLNMDFIKYMDEDNLILRDETKIPISQRKSKVSKLKYMAHLMKGCE